MVDKRLARSERTHVGRRPRTTYTLTGEGRCALESWLATPPRATSLECEALLRILFADLCTPDQLRVALDQVRADAEAILAVGRTVGREYLDGTAPFQDQVHVRAFVFDFLSHHARMLLEWAERTDAELSRWPQLTHEQRAKRALASIRRDLREFPPAASERDG